jgi:uncharacterized membrane protein
MEDRIFADRVNDTVGSMQFVKFQTIFLIAYMAFNIWSGHAFDPFPFILLNLFLSFQSAYTGPFVMMSQNRASARDRVVLNHIEQMAIKMETLEEQNAESLAKIAAMEERILELLSKNNGL